MFYFTCFILIVNILFASVYEVKSDKGKGNCVIKTKQNHTLTDQEWRYGFKLDPVNDYEEKFVIISQLYYDNIKEVTKPTPNDLFGYFFTKLDWTVKVFEIKTDHEFVKYEEKENENYTRFRVEFLCRNDYPSEITFLIPINDTNNHQPKFLNAPYEFTVPMPIPKGYNFDLSGKIIARDIDLTNKNITFHLDQKTKYADAFILSSSGPDTENVKNYPAMFVASNTVDLEDDVTYTVYATDSGNPPLTTNTSIKIIVDKANSFPRFTRSLYTSNLTNLVNVPDLDNETNVGMILSFLEGNIIIDRGYKNLENVEIRKVFNANKDDFVVKRTDLDNYTTIHIDLVNWTEQLWQQKVVTLILAAIKDGVEATTVVQILLPGNTEDKSTGDEITCVEHASAQVIIEGVSSSGYIAATVILSLVSIGLLGYVGYFSFYRKE